MRYYVYLSFLTQWTHEWTKTVNFIFCSFVHGCFLNLNSYLLRWINIWYLIYFSQEKGPRRVALTTLSSSPTPGGSTSAPRRVQLTTLSTPSNPNTESGKQVGSSRSFISHYTAPCRCLLLCCTKCIEEDVLKKFPVKLISLMK